MQLRSFCPLDCPDACSLALEVSDGRVARVEGSRVNPLTAGFICAKVRRLPEHLYGHDRVLQPAVRSGPKGERAFRPVGWEEALELVARRLREVRERSGGEAILPLCYGGSNGLLTQGSVDERLFRRLGASRLARTVCAAPTSAVARAMYGRMPGVAFEEYEHARLIVLWGCNPAVTGIHLLPYLRAARRRGARLVVVDPRRHRLARQADLHLPVRPGTDVVVALAVARWLFEQGAADEPFLRAQVAEVEEFRARAGRWDLAAAAAVADVDARAIETLARWYADSSPAVIRCGWGVERNRNGGSAAAAVLALPAIAGKFGVRGGGYTLSNSGAFDLDASGAIRAEVPPTRTINMNRLGRALLETDDPPIEALFVYDANPAVTLPNQELVLAGLAREDLFTVVYEQVWTDTARFADVVLPATAFPEHAELRAGYGSMTLQYAPAAVHPPGQARPNYRVFAELCARLGLQRPGDPVEPEELLEAIVGAEVGARLRREGIVQPPAGARPVLMRDVSPRTADGRIHLVPAELDAQAPGGLYAWRPDPASEAAPLALISPATGRTISSTFGQLLEGPARLQMHPHDAAERGLRDGARVRVFNDRGEVHCELAVTRRVRPGVVLLPKGLWLRHTRNGRTGNVLVGDEFTDLAGGATFNDARVQVEALA